MGPREFLTTVAFAIALMGLAALVELVVPLRMRPAAPTGRGRTNIGMTVLTFAVNWGLTSAAALLAAVFALRGSSAMSVLGVPLVAQVVTGVLIIDLFFGYVAHRAMHASSLLWRVHRVHHSDPFVDVTTTFRNHPLEGLWRYMFVIVPVWILSLPAEAVVAHRVLSVINGFLEHANIRLWPGVDRILALLWVTPDMHKVHHSRRVAETDSNYGNLVSIYDRALGTFTATERAASVVYGLEDVQAEQVASVTGLLTLPFQSAVTVARKVRLGTLPSVPS